MKPAKYEEAAIYEIICLRSKERILSMKPGVYLTHKKDGSPLYRSSITFQGKHISLGSYPDEQAAHDAYTAAANVLRTPSYTLLRTAPPLPFFKYVSLVNFRDNGLYIKTPIYLYDRYFYYYMNPDEYYIFDVDDLFYYSTHSILKRGGHLFVSDYGMQVNILSRYGIHNYAVAGRDYVFLNGDSHDMRYENIRVINHFLGVCKKTKNYQDLYECRIHVNGDILVGRYPTETEAAIAFNKAADLLHKKGYRKQYPKHFIEHLSSTEYRKIYDRISISSAINNYPNC